MLTLNLRFGQLTFTKNGEAEFRTFTPENNQGGDDN
jgi:hypothetical protein